MKGARKALHAGEAQLLIFPAHGRAGDSDPRILIHMRDPARRDVGTFTDGNVTLMAVGTLNIMVTGRL